MTTVHDQFGLAVQVRCPALLDDVTDRAVQELQRAIDGVRIDERVGSCGTAAYQGKPVDDEPNILLMISDSLRRAGYEEIVSTTDPHTALELFRAEPPDLLILDLRMPGPDGLEFLENLHEEIGPDDYLPVIALTADVRIEARRRRRRTSCRSPSIRASSSSVSACS